MNQRHCILKNRIMYAIEWAIGLGTTMDRSHSVIGWWIFGMQDWLAWTKLCILLLLQLFVCAWGRVKVSYICGCGQVHGKLVVLDMLCICILYFQLEEGRGRPRVVGLLVVSDAHVFPGFLTPVLTQLSFQSHQLLFSHASAELIGENTSERKFASNRYQTYKHQVMSPICSPLSHPGWKKGKWWSQTRIHWHCLCNW